MRRARDHLHGMFDDDAHPRTIPRTPHTAYTSDNHLLTPTLATRSIIHSIDWQSLPDEHPLTPERSGDGWTPREWELISEYARVRGAAAHALNTAGDAEDAAKALRRELAALGNVEDPEAMHDAVTRWPGSHRVTPPEDLDALGDTPRDALHRAAKDSARSIADNWDMAAREHDWTSIINEATILADIDDTQFCARPDQVLHIPDSPSLPRGLYAGDAKTVERIQPEHVMQAEAQRRALDARIADDADAHALLLRLSPERGDYDVITSHDDEWLDDTAWDLFQRRAESLYNDTRVQAGVRQLAEDGR